MLNEEFKDFGFNFVKWGTSVEISQEKEKPEMFVITST